MTCPWRFHSLPDYLTLDVQTRTTSPEVQHTYHLSFFRTINQKMSHCSAWQIHETKHLIQACPLHLPSWLKIKRKSSLSLSAKPFKDVPLQQRFPGKAYCSEFSLLWASWLPFRKRPPLFASNPLFPYLGEKHFRASDWYRWNTPALFPTYKENLDASRWYASGFVQQNCSIRACSHYPKFCLNCKKICQCEAISIANNFFAPTKIFASTTKLQRFRRLALEAVKRKSFFPWHPSVIGSSNFSTYGLRSECDRMTSCHFNWA